VRRRLANSTAPDIFIHRFCLDEMIRRQGERVPS
jgi:hypothetical protein